METQDNNYQYIGKARKLVEGMEKVTGRARYAGDVNLPGMLHIRLVYSPYAHANILSIDTDDAAAMPGVVAVLTAQDLPTKDLVMASRNSTILAKDKVLFVGEPVVAVVAQSEAEAQDAAEMVFVDYEPLPVVADMERAVLPNSPLVWPNGLPTAEIDLSAAHAETAAKTGETNGRPPNVHETHHFERGDIAKGFAEADVIIEHTYKMARVHQTYLEPHAVVAVPDKLKNTLTLYTSTQGQFQVRDEVANYLGFKKSQVRVEPMAVGGAFGAKYGIFDTLAGSVALAINRPVRLRLSRSEDFLTTTPSPSGKIHLKTGATKDGKLTALQAQISLDNGVYAVAFGTIVAVVLGGYYKIDNVQIDGYEVNTHTPQIGAYRAPGAPHGTLAIESNMDELARALGMDPLELRYQNAVEDGDPTGINRPWPNVGLKKCLDTMRAHPAWANRNKGENEGIGLAIGGWPNFMSPAGAICRVDNDGTVKLHLGIVDVSGVNSSFALIAAETLGVTPEDIEILCEGTHTAPFGPGSGGSKILYSVGGAVEQAAASAKQQILNLAADKFEASPEDIEISEGMVQVRGVPDQAIPLGDIAEMGYSANGGSGPIIGEGRSAQSESGPGFVAHLVKVHVDPDTGQITPKQYVAIQDVGFAINPMMVEGQIHGGSIQGLGMGLHEAMVYDQEGQLLTGSFMDYSIPKAPDVPNIETILVNNPSPHGPFGIRGVGEPPITAGAAAIANAVRDATGARMTEIPIRSEALWQAIQNGESA